MLRVLDLRAYAAGTAIDLPRAMPDREAARSTVREIVAAVRARGDEAVLEAQRRYGVAPETMRVDADEILRARAGADAELVAAIQAAAARIRGYHERQMELERAHSWGIGDEESWVGEESRPVRRAGCYVPGGRAAYPSTVLMTTIPARAAGVASVAVAVPPAADGRVHPATLTACAVARVDEVYAVGGAQGIAAFAYGTESVARADVVVGPGNLYVTLAKHEVAMDVGVDSFAGPTEVAVVADERAPAPFVAADLVAQAEHDPLATAILVTPSEALVARVEEALEKEVASATRREDVETALTEHGLAVLVRDLDHAMEVVERFAPEHLEIVTEDARERAKGVRCAGAVFVGAFSPVALGDYVAGTNHVLPTAGSARFASPLRASHFLRSTAIVSFARSGLERVAPSLLALAEAEGLDAHARALRIRLEDTEQ